MRLWGRALWVHCAYWRATLFEKSTEYEAVHLELIVFESVPSPNPSPGGRGTTGPLFVAAADQNL
ncbi:hypothetical protein XAP412_1310079 [Xanthomonas phaseoli pv. phaseoli]|uniref:Uncharacterized protein n=1 Tax=Xanthomonas campestris pv. phaseoli TaxID=317013 RepID=A0AB38DY92_XANCH|nr:hypothetical protein XAP6984_1330085 [Xanthomonas phaseoli pv. phaseoli]SON79891.1 hypothetical protein XAP412_1310079 [Xanthomonas phaseoli pv. phaseoli]SON83049.1 hypothetical protein XAP7430_1310085 [Xanthomonas phaseoli pv. phaseoli]SOO32133.1 hypothetical protein XAP6164_810007 [Xanthomonas phaseoli pv. phaseoli]